MASSSATAAIPKPQKDATLCEICNVFVPPGNTDMHNSGKKHKRNEVLRSKNMPVPMKTKPSLQTKVQTSNEQPLSRKAAMRAERSERTIFLTKLPAGILELELTDHFSLYGPVANAKIFKGGTQGCVIFGADIDFMKIVCAKNVLHGKRIIISKSPPPQTKTTQQRDYFPKEDISKGQYVYEKIRGLPIQEQIEKFLSVVSLTPKDISDRTQLVESMTQKMQEFFPGSRLEIFGSTSSGLGFRGCDIDIIFFLPFERDENQILVLEQVPTFTDVRTGKFPQKDLSYMSREDILHFLWKFLLKSPEFRFARLIPSVRCPIIKFHHSANGLSVCGDISFNRRLGIANTRVLQLYSQLDPRIHVLLMILRFWAKRENIVGMNHMITSYAFSWLIIFYLQDIKMVPTLETLAALADEKNEADTWDCSFCDDKSKIPMDETSVTIAELLTGFFGFYAAFDFTVNVICPRDGNIVPKTKLIELAGEDLDFNITDLSVQDVFNLTHNITAYVNATTIQTFMSQCNVQHACWQEMQRANDFSLQPLFYSQTVPANLRISKTPKEKHTFAAPLPLSRSVYLPLKSNVTNTEYSVKTLCDFVMDIFKRICLYEFTVTENTLGDGGSDNPSLVTESTLGDASSDKPLSLTESTFGDGSSDDSSSSLKRTVSQDNTNNKRLKTSDNGSASTQEDVVLRVICNVTRRVWDGRRNVKGYVSTTPHTSQFEIQEDITNAIAKRDELKPSYILHEFESVFAVCGDQLKVTFIANGTKPELLNAVLPFTNKTVSLLAKSCLELDAKVEP